MTANSYYAQFRDLYEQAIGISEEIRRLSAEGRQEGVDVATIKRYARLVATEKLRYEAAKYRKLRDLAEENGQQELFE